MTATFTEQFVCLAKSRKNQGCCIAGKRLNDGSWIRPVDDHIVSAFMPPLLHARYENGLVPKVLDIIEVPCVTPKPRDHQVENVEIAYRAPWKKLGRASWEEVVALVDAGADLWVNGHSSTGKLNDRVPETVLDPTQGSLRLLQLDSLLLYRRHKKNKPCVQAHFEYQGEEYKLDVTDTRVEKEFLLSSVVSVEIPGPVVVCVSLGEVFNGFAYKLIAGVILPKRQENS